VLESPPLRLVRQEDANGCMIACLAMVAGLTYAAARALFHPWYFEQAAFNGFPLCDIESVLGELGYASIVRHEHCHFAACDRAAWPPDPWADRHICSVVPASGRGTHGVVLRGDGAVLDPWAGPVASLSAYPRCYTVASIHRVSAAKLPQSPDEHWRLPVHCGCRAAREIAV
jgi:hypothetical protein